MKTEMQELIEAAEERLTAEGMEANQRSVLRLQKAISSARKASEGGWIDCKQELPQHGGKYLAVIRGFTDAKILWWSIEHKFWSHMANETPLDVSYYQPIPSPPLSVEKPNTAPGANESGNISSNSPSFTTGPRVEKEPS